MGQVPKATREGDQFVIILGLDVLFVVRHQGDHVSLIGECFVRGLMDREAVVGLDEGEKEEFDL